MIREEGQSMTSSELIRLLSKLEPDTMVVFETYNRMLHTVPKAPGTTLDDNYFIIHIRSASKPLSERIKNG